MTLSRRALLGGLSVAAALPWTRPARAAEPAWLTATELLAGLNARHFSSRELLDACIARITALDPLINAVVVRDFDRARQAADSADAARARADPRPLLGLPMTVKEQYNVAGLPTTWGYEAFRDWRPSEDALAVQRLKAAGAIIIGKTNVPTGLSDWQSRNPIYGATNNPWDLTRTPGGSSGGSAAALAAGFVSLELGSDLGGSLRAPAHFCGVFAHKPSLDLVPQRGAGYPGTAPVAIRDDLAVAGPLARSAADLDLELSLLAGPDDLLEGKGYTLHLPPPRHDRLTDFRVLVIDSHPLCPTAEGVKAAIETLAGRLGQAGCTVLRRSPAMPGLAPTTRVYAELLAAMFDADNTPADHANEAEAAAALAPENQSLRAAELRGGTMSHAAWISTTDIRTRLRSRWSALFQEIDVLLCPPMPTTAFPQDYAPILTRRLTVDGKSIPYLDQVAWCAVATLNGFPATVMPIGLSGGLPTGVQIVGGYLEDRTTITFAGLVEREFGGFVAPPALR